MKYRAVAAGLLIFGSAAFGADPQLMNMLMPDAKIIAGANATSVENSPLGQFLIARVQSGSPGIQNIVTAIGFNPFTDVAEFLAATSAAKADFGGLLLMRGNFKVSQMTTALQSAHLRGMRARVRVREGTTTIVFAPRRQPKGAAVPTKPAVPAELAFIGDNIAVAGDAASVEAALARTTAGSSIDPALAVKINTLGGNGDVWILSTGSLAGLIPAAPAGNPYAGPALQILKNIQSFSGSVKLGSDDSLAATVTTTDNANAVALSNVVRLLVSLASMNTGSNPQIPAVLQLLKGLQVTTSGADVNLALTVPEATIEDIVKSKPAAAARGN